MKNIFFAFVFTMAIAGCDTPENTSGNEMSAPPISTSDSALLVPENQDTVLSTPVDTISSIPTVPADTVQ